MKSKFINILFYIVVFFMILSFVLLRPLNNLDEIWIYNVSRNIVDGKLIYKEISMIATPLAYYINALSLIVFENEMVILRIVSSIVAVLILYFTNKIFLQIGIKDSIIKLILIVIAVIYIYYFCADYNFYSLLNVLIIIWLEILVVEKFNFYSCSYIDIVLGILAGCAILFKQSIGVCIAGMLLFYKILWVRKENIKVFIKLFMVRLLGCMLVISIFLIYLFSKGILYDFFDYTVLALKTFSNSIPYYRLFSTSVGFFALLAPINIIYMVLICFLRKETDYKLKILTMYSLVNFIMVFPISDTIHFLIAFLPSLILMIYLLFSKIGFKIEIKLYIQYVAIISCFSLSIFNIYLYCNSNISKYLNHYDGIIVNKELEKRIVEIGDFLKQNENVLILDSRAALFMIPSDLYNKNYDMFALGNFGENGENGLISDLKSKDGVKLLVLNDNYSLNWQTPLNVIQFVKSNYSKVGEIDVFDIYEKTF